MTYKRRVLFGWAVLVAVIGPPVIAEVIFGEGLLVLLAYLALMVLVLLHDMAELIGESLRD